MCLLRYELIIIFFFLSRIISSGMTTLAGTAQQEILPPTSMLCAKCANDIPLTRASLENDAERKSNSARGPKAQGQNWTS